MPWRNAYIATRTHPLALTVYAVVFLLGLLTILGPTNPTSIFALLPHFWQWIWEYTTLIGGAAGLFGCFWKDVILGLLIEQTGALMCTIGLLVYGACITDIIGLSSTGLLLILVLLVGCAYRTYQTITDSRKVAKLVQRVLEDKSHAAS